jgi:uncharacterized protein
MDPVVHFEMPYDDSDRMAKFYKAVFGWKTKSLGEQMGNYVVAHTGKTSADGMIDEPGRINGGFFARDMSKPGQHPSVVIAVRDIQKAMDKVAEAGGQVHGEPMDIPGVGAYVAFTDTEGNRVSLLKPLPMAKAAKKAPARETKSKASTPNRKKKRS